jgi:hypothetical protein
MHGPMNIKINLNFTLLNNVVCVTLFIYFYLFIIVYILVKQLDLQLKMASNTCFMLSHKSYVWKVE